YDRDRFQPVDHGAQHGSRKPAKIAELIEETLQSSVPAGGLDILLQIGYATDELRKMIAIEPQNIYRCAAAHRRVSGSPLRQCGLPKRVTGFQHAQRDFVTVWLVLAGARALPGQHVQ